MLNGVLEVNDESIQIDHEGFLLEPADWNEDVAHAIAKKEGMFVGMSSGAALYAAQEIAKKIESGRIVVIFPDRGEKYLSTKLFD